MAGSSTSSSSSSATSSTSARSPPPYPQTATRRPAPGAPRTFPGSEPAPPYDSINPPNPSPGFPGVNDDDLPPWYTWGSKPPFFAAISREDVSELQRLIDLDSKIVNTRDSKDRTPLYYATITYKANIEIVRCLLECGANVDDWSTEYLPPQTSSKMEWRSRSHKPRKYKTQRTPLMAACERNHLPIARLLLEAPYNADTKMIAPDGQHALRLASDAGAREIVRLLPSLRAGGWERLKYRSKPHIDKMKKVALAMYKVGKFLVYDLPKFLVREIPKALYHIAKWLLRFLWDSAKGIVRFLIKLPVELFRLLVRIPGAIWRGVRDIWRGVKAAPGLLKAFLTSTLPIFIKDIYEVSRDILVGTVKYSWSVAKWLFKKIFIQIPELIFNGCVALCRKIKDLGEWFLNLLTSFASLLHTFAEWVVRNCTWHNVMQGLNTTLKFFFVDIPVGLWDAVKLIYAGFEHLVLGIFGCFGYVLLLLFRAVMWFPYKFRSILVSCGKMAAEAWKEIRVWIDPKAEV